MQLHVTCQSFCVFVYLRHQFQRLTWFILYVCVRHQFERLTQSLLCFFLYRFFFFFHTSFSCVPVRAGWSLLLAVRVLAFVCMYMFSVCTIHQLLFFPSTFFSWVDVQYRELSSSLADVIGARARWVSVELISLSSVLVWLLPPQQSVHPPIDPMTVCHANLATSGPRALWSHDTVPESVQLCPQVRQLCRQGRQIWSSMTIS